MSKLRKRLVSIVIACMMVITLVPFSGSKVNAAEEYTIDKISINLKPGTLIKPGYDVQIPGALIKDTDYEIDEANTDAASNKGLKSGDIIIDSIIWEMKENNGTWESYSGTFEVGTYRMHVKVKTNAYDAYVNHVQYENVYTFDMTSEGESSFYVNGSRLETDSANISESDFYGPEFSITESSKAEYVPENTTDPTPTPTPNTQQPTAQPTAQPEVLSTKITGAPTNLVCSLTNADTKKINVEFEPNLDCGIDTSCYLVVAASTDNKATWKEVIKQDLTGIKTLSQNTNALRGSYSFKIELETTYYVKVYYVDSDGKKGPDSNICGPFGPVEDESKIPGKVEEASKVALKETGNDAGVLKKGTSVTFERAFYKLTLSVKDIKGTDVTFAVNLAPNKPYDAYLFMSHGSISYKDKKGDPRIEFFMNEEATIDMSNIEVGCTKITIPVTAELLQKYDRNQKKYKFEETFYFDNAPQTPSLGVTKADKKSITLGKAYSATANCTDSGTTVYYKKKGASKWKEKSFAKGKTIKLTGLSAGTSYQIKAVNFVKSKDRNGKVKTISSNESNVNIFRTAYKSSPKVKSVKTSKVKQKTKKFNGQWVKSGNKLKWQKPYTLNVTTYKLTIKMKSKPTNAGGIVVKDPDGVVHIIKGAKKKYTLSSEIKGFKKGQTVKFKVATFGNGDKVDNITGVSPYKTINVTLR
ncbi:MAG: hypothetical protein J5517_05995 [Eubacterium sp.]|nr:hypothetical protein [Eubacterium sp.]